MKALAISGAGALPSNAPKPSPMMLAANKANSEVLAGEAPPAEGEHHHHHKKKHHHHHKKDDEEAVTEL